MLATRVRDAVRQCVESASQRTLLDVVEGRTENEPTFSVQLATRVQDCLNDLDIEGHRIQVSIRTVQDRGRGAAERRYGTDLVVVVRIDTDEMSVTKGLLVQAKNEGSEGVHVGGVRRQRVEVTTLSPQLRAQCRKMLRISASSYVWIYDPTGVRSATAVSIEAAKPGRTRKRVPSSRLEDHIDDLVACKVGDPRIVAHDDGTLDRLLDEVGAETALLLEVSQPPTEGSNFA